MTTLALKALDELRRRQILLSQQDLTRFDLIRAELERCAALTERETDADIWLLYYEDTDLKHPEIFKGPGARAAALHLYKDALINWTCHLFRAVSLDGKPSVADLSAPKGWVEKDDLSYLGNKVNFIDLCWCADGLYEPIALYLTPPSNPWRAVAEGLADEYLLYAKTMYGEVSAQVVKANSPAFAAFAAAKEQDNG